MNKIFFIIAILIASLVGACDSLGKKVVDDSESKVQNLLSDTEVVASALDGVPEIVEQKLDTVLLADGDYKVFLQEMEKAEYDSLYSKFYKKEDPAVAIYSLDSILTELASIGVEVKGIEGDEEEDHGGFGAIKTPNGMRINYESNFMEIVAYYPNYHLLLLEGGHAEALGFNVLTGEDIDEAGNPATQTFSPNKKFRFSSVWGGQECSEQILQLVVDDQFVKIPISDGAWVQLCNCYHSFWVDDYTFCYGTGYSEAHRFFKIVITPENE